MITFDPSDLFSPGLTGGGSDPLSQDAAALLNELRNTLGDEWLDAPNSYFGVLTPREMLRIDLHAFKELLESVSASALS